MRIVNFKYLEGKNFLSFGDKVTKISLRPGVNAIIGSNFDKEDSKNGAGKSAVTEMLYYCLYGTTLREISKDHIQNSVTKKRCEVSLEFDVESNSTKDTYKVYRQLNPTKCSVYKNGEDITRSTLIKTNNLIQEIIHTPASVFQNSVIMSANNAVPFMALAKTDKRKFIESVLGLEVFTQMLLKARDEFNNAKKDYEICYSKFETLNNELEFNSNQLANYEEAKNQRIEQLKNKQQTLLKEIDSYKKTLKPEIIITEKTQQDFEYYTQKLQSSEAKQKQLASHIVKLDAEIASEHKQKTKLETTKDSCPTCNRGYSDEHVAHVKHLVQSHLNVIAEKNKLKEMVSEGQIKLSIEIDNIHDALKQISNLKQEGEEIKRHNDQVLVHINYSKNSIKELEKEIQVCSIQHNNDLKGKVSALEVSVKENKERIDGLNSELNVLESVKYVLSEEGIKSFLVKKILTVLNSRLAFYLKKLEANCLCRFNEFFDEEIIDESSNQKSYFNFSGGERKRIDLACLFAFADIRRLQGDVNFNTVFYDELLDSSLDDKGVALTVSVLRDRFTENNESCYIISHRGTWVTTKAEHVIHVAKRNGVSEIVS